MTVFRMDVGLSALLLVIVASDLSAQKDDADDNFVCPERCTCLAPVVDCGERAYQYVPEPIPDWTNELRLNSNELTEVNPGLLSHLKFLRELDFSGNQLHRLVVRSASLQKLFVSYNKLKSIPQFPIRHPNLTILNLSHNEISKIDAASLSRLPFLETMELSGNHLVEINTHSFPQLPRLRYLFLSHNRISAIGLAAFDNVSNLESLKLSRNRLQSLTKYTFLQLKFLKSLDLSRNYLQQLATFAFQGLDALVTLKMKKNQLMDLPDAIFMGLISLRHLHLDSNAIQAVREGWTYNMSRLETLSMTFNKIVRLDRRAFALTLRMRSLRLSHNRINSLSPRQFALLHHLTSLQVDHNNISILDPLVFQGLDRLVTLDLSHNNMRFPVTQQPSPFSSLPELHKLSLASNMLHVIPSEAFSDLPKLHSLVLTSNDVQRFSNSAIPSSLSSLAINSSSLLCDCRLDWLRDWVREHPSISTLSCALPRSLRARKISTLTSRDMPCDDWAAPRIVVEESGSRRAFMGQNLTLHCAAESSKPSTKLFWMKDMRPVHESLLRMQIDPTKSAIGDASNITRVRSVFSVASVAQDSSGVYVCVAFNQYGSAQTAGIQVDVYVLPKFTKRPAHVQVREGTSVQLPCSATGYPPPVIYWEKDGSEDFPAVRERRIRIEQKENLFVITDVKLHDSGVYSCYASNNAGTISANASLHVLAMPKIEHQPPVHAEVGSMAVLECTVSGSPSPNITWWHDNHEIHASDHYSVAGDRRLLVVLNVQSEDSGIYSCLASNMVGQQASEMELIVTNLSKPGTGSKKWSQVELALLIGIPLACIILTSFLWFCILTQCCRRSGKRDRLVPPCAASASSSDTTMSRQGAPLLGRGSFRKHQPPPIVGSSVESSCVSTASSPSSNSTDVPGCGPQQAETKQFLRLATREDSDSESDFEEKLSPPAGSFHPNRPMRAFEGGSNTPSSVRAQPAISQNLNKPIRPNIISTPYDRRMTFTSPMSRRGVLQVPPSPPNFRAVYPCHDASPPEETSHITRHPSISSAYDLPTYPKLYKPPPHLAHMPDYYVELLTKKAVLGDRPTTLERKRVESRRGEGRRERV